MRRTCESCGGAERVLDPCGACSGTGYSEVRCRECHRWQPVDEFLAAGVLVKVCRGCRTRTVVRESARVDVGPLRFRLVPESRNRKTGPIPVTMTSSRTCPPGCPWRGSGCYGGQDFSGMHWRRLEREGLTLAELCERLAALSGGQLWRHNEAGDLPGDGDLIDREAFADLVRASRNSRGFTYTHKPVVGEGEAARENRKAILGVMGSSFTVNLSADGLEQADELAGLDVAPVAVVVPRGTPRSTRTPAGRLVTTCPATYLDDVSCRTCELCWRRWGRAIVAFPAHGTLRSKMSQRLLQLRLFDT